MVTVTNNRNNLKKEDIARNIFVNIGIPFSYSAKIVTDITEIILVNLLLRKKIKIKNFGIFSLKQKNERIGRNPKNKKEYIISSRVVTLFKAAKKLNTIINKNVQKKQ